MAPKTFRLGPRLRYPITISKLVKNNGDEVNKQETVMQYTYNYERTVGDPDLDEERTIQERGWGDWDCPTEGKISKWKVKVGEVIQKDQPLVDIDETCPHDQQYAGLCVLCGKDMKEVSWASESLDTNRATIAMVHDNTALLSGPERVGRVESDLQQRLLRQRKLSLVVDLDQTIIHACIEPTVGEWQKDPTNPNYEAVKDVKSFQLEDGPRGLTSGCWYYIKQRPGLEEFLQKMSELFEMHVYTMGTRAYAEKIANIVDPEKKLFANRVISRDENGNMIAKNLRRLFPVNTNMVVVIDDRADVWPGNRPNLIKVTPYDFFKGIGDINSSFLPKREPEITPAAAAPVEVPVRDSDAKEQPPDAPAKKDETKEDQKIPAKTTDENVVLQLQAEEQERELEKQLKERPLLHLQEELDKEDADDSTPPADAKQDTDETQEGTESPFSHNRHNLLRDDDRELFHLEQHLKMIHQKFYEQYDAGREARNGTAGLAITTPDVGRVLDRLKSRVLRGCRIVLSGLLPIGVDARHSEIGLQTINFGAELRTSINDKVTHLVVSNSRPRTEKVRRAARIPSIKIVNQDWLLGSLQHWKKLDEKDFTVEVHPADRLSAPGVSKLKIAIVQRGKAVDDGESSVGDDGEEEDESGLNTGSSADEDDDGEMPDVEGLIPKDLADGQRSPIEDMRQMDWGDVDDELKDFIGSDDDESGSEKGSEAGDNTDASDGESNRGMKRRLNGDDEDEDDGESVLAKKQRRAKARTTGLRNVKNAGDDADGSGLPTPMDTGNEESAAGDGDGDGDGDAANGDDDDDDFDDLEAELEAELAAAAELEKG